MQNPSQAIQILTTLEYLGLYNSVPYFGVVLQTGVGPQPGGTLTITPDIKNILEPWMWWDPTQPQPAPPATASSPLNVQQPQIQLWQTTGASPMGKLIATEVVPVPRSTSPAYPNRPLYLDPSITTQLSADCDSALTLANGTYNLGWSGQGQVTSRGDGKSIYPWPAHLAQVGRYPYPIPHLLNLCFFLKVTAAKTDFDPSSVIQPIDATHPSLSYFATVKFNATLSASTVTYGPPDPATFPSATGGQLVIPLINSQSPADNSVAVTTQPLITPLAPAATVVAASADYTAETTDWQAHFSSGVADTFDLSARLVNSVRLACDQASATLPVAVAGNFTGFVTAVLTAQREIVAYGCQPAPNGQSLLDRLLNGWVSSSNDPNNRAFATAFSTTVKAQRTTETTNDATDANNVGAYDAWLALLKANPAFATNALLPPSPIASTTITVFDPTKNYKTGDTVVYHGQTFTAVQDAPKSTQLDAAHWNCLTPLLSIYDASKKQYHGAEQVLYGDTVYRAPDVGVGTGQTPGISGSPWIAVSPFSPGVAPTNLADRLLAVEHLQLQFSQQDILSQLLLAQWKAIFDQNAAAIQTTLALTGTLVASTAFQSFVTSASANLAVWDVRGLLLQCNLNSSWSTITKSPTTRDTLQTKLQKELEFRLTTGLLGKLPGAAGAVPAFAQPLQDAVDTWLAGRLPTLIPAKLDTSVAGGPPPAPTTTTTANPQATRGAQGLSVMVDTLDANGSKAAASNDASDPVRSMTGLCVLMRQTSTTPWRCLNVGMPVATVVSLPTNAPPVPAVQDPANPKALFGPIVIPMPLHDQDGLRRATLTYNNQPLMCSSPAHGFSTGLVPAPVRDESRNFNRIISFQHISVTQDLQAAPFDQWKIPGLAFNRSYEFLLGTVSNSGALPAAFADASLGPGVFSFASVASAIGADGNPLLPTITPVPYLRTVPVSDLRFASSYPNDTVMSASVSRAANAAASFDKLRLPPIPADVQPRASEVFASALAPQSTATASAQPAVGSPPEKPSMPLILLSPYSVPNRIAEFTVSVRKPTTDFLTWDRTQAALSTPADMYPRVQRQQAWQLFNTNARLQNSQFDLSLEDPAIDSLTISVIDENKKPVVCVGPSTLSWGDSSIQDPATAKALQKPSTPIIIKISTAEGTTVSLNSTPAASSTDSPAFTLVLPPGFLGKITLTANIKSVTTAQFAKGISSTPSPYFFLVETALAAFPQPGELQNALSIRPPLAATDPVTFTLSAPSPSDSLSTPWKQVSRVDLQTQIWRWDGRPARGFPFSEVVGIQYYGGSKAPVPPPQVVPIPPSQPATATLLQWELENFATRTATDSTTYPMTRSRADFVATDDRGTELGATYYRAGVTAYNRYGSLVPDVVSGTGGKPDQHPRSSASLNQFASIPGADGAWVRRFVPGRYTTDGVLPANYKPPKPAIKYILPLTGASDALQPAASSVLVVVQGPWFAIAGLAEDISVRIVNADKQDHPKEVPEAGPDPIYYQSSQQPLPSSFDPYPSPFTPPNDNGSKLLFHGPVGHTFDTSDTNPLWVTSSFVLDPPQERFLPVLPPGQDATQEGTFACVQFARILLSKGMVVSDPTKTPPQHVNGTPALTPATADTMSDYTDPVWVQFLPSRYLPVSSSQDFDTLAVVYDQMNNKMVIYDEKDSTKLVQLTHNLHPDPKVASNYIFGLLLTQEVPDLLGRRGQERFVDMLLQPNEGTASASWPFTPQAWVDTKMLIGRIVVIQRQINISTGCNAPSTPPKFPLCDIKNATDLWPELFPPDPTQDAVSRIVAVSPPIITFDPTALPRSCKKDTTFSGGN